MSDTDGFRAGMAGFKREIEDTSGEIESGDQGGGGGDDRDARPRFRGVRLLGKCEHCGMPLPLLGPLREIPCTHCQETNRFSVGFWVGLIDALDNNPNIDEWSDHVEVDTKTAPPPVELKGSAVAAPDWITERVDTARCFYGALHEGQSGGLAGPDVDEQAPRPVAMACPKCGAGLDITVENPRNSTCEYCKTDIYLPDALWLKLHPIMKATRWYVEYRGLSRADRTRRRQSEARRRQTAEDLEHEERRAALRERERIANQIRMLEKELKTAKSDRIGMQIGFWIFLAILSMCTPAAIMGPFNDGVFGLMGDIVCPLLCDSCVGPYEEVLGCPAAAGYVRLPGGLSTWYLLQWFVWFLFWGIILFVGYRIWRKKNKAQEATVEGRLEFNLERIRSYRSML